MQLSIRSKFLLIVLGGAILPLGLVGAWLARSAERSGEALLHDRMQTAVQRVVHGIGVEWIRLRADLLHLTEDEVIQRSLEVGTVPNGEQLAALIPRYAESPSRIHGLVMERGEGGANAVVSSPDAPPGFADPLLRVELPFFDSRSGVRRGVLRAGVEIGALLPGGGAATAGIGSVLAVFDRSTGASLIPLPFDPALLSAERFVWAGDEWLTVRHRLNEPSLDLVLAAPLTPHIAPFERAARQGALALLLVAGLGLAVATLLTRRITGSLHRLADATDAVTRGELDRQVEEEGGREVARVAGAFNQMTANLRSTLDELSQRRGLAALGEFAAILAHEIRNPLTSVRIDLQRVQEKLPPDSPVQPTVVRTLRQIERLNGTVSGVLSLARSGQVVTAPVDLRIPLRAAIDAARPSFQQRGAHLAPLDAPEEVPVRGDPSALQQLFLNLLLNAAEALPEGGRAQIQVQTEGRRAVVAVQDDGPGIPHDVAQRLFEPFFTTRAEGTGLGLPVAQRIAVAHGGTLDIASDTQGGTSVRLEIPVLP